MIRMLNDVRFTGGAADNRARRCAAEVEHAHVFVFLLNGAVVAIRNKKRFLRYDSSIGKSYNLNILKRIF